MSDKIQQTTEILLKKNLTTVALLAVPLNIVSFFALRNSEYQIIRGVPIILGIAVIALALFMKKLSFSFKIRSYVLLLMSTGSLSLLLGLLDLAGLWFVLAIINSFLSTSKKAPFYIFIVSLILITITGILMMTKIIFIPIDYGFQNCQFACVSVRIINFLIIGFSVFYILNALLSATNDYINELQEKNKVLEKLSISVKKEMEKKLKIEELKTSLEYKEKELNHKRKEIAEVITKIVSFNKTLKSIKNAINKKQEEEALKIISNNLNSNYNWQRFLLSFNELHPTFLTNLREKFPLLTETETKLCAFLLMRLKTSQIAEILTISDSSVSKYRNRLRKKLDLESGADISIFLEQMI